MNFVMDDAASFEPPRKMSYETPVAPPSVAGGAHSSVTAFCEIAPVMRSAVVGDDTDAARAFGTNAAPRRKAATKAVLRRLVERLRRLPACPPLLVKIAPDLEDEAIDAIARLAYEEGLAGVIAVNTSLNRLGFEQRRIAQTGRTLAQEAGGLSGAPLRARALEVMRRLRVTAGPGLPLIGVGGIASAEDAYARIRAGASLIQLYSALVYEGPGLARRINRGLAALLRRDGFTSIADAVGVDIR